MGTLPANENQNPASPGVVSRGAGPRFCAAVHAVQSAQVDGERDRREGGSAQREGRHRYAAQDARKENTGSQSRAVRKSGEWTATHRGRERLLSGAVSVDTQPEAARALAAG